MEVDEEWFIKLPGNDNLILCNIRYITDLVVTFTYTDTYFYRKTYKLSDLDIVERKV